MPHVEILLPYRHFEPGQIVEFDGGVADIVVRRGFGKYVQVIETAAVKQPQENTTQQTRRTFKGKQ